jgi:hypothetical protein
MTYLKTSIQNKYLSSLTSHIRFIKVKLKHKNKPYKVQLDLIYSHAK